MGWFRDQVMQRYEVNDREYELAAQFPIQAAMCYRASRQAYEEALRRYPDTAFTNGPGDAFRHAYWNALMVKRVGMEFADLFAGAHELVPDQPTRELRMDLHNNEVGRRIGHTHRRSSDDVIAQRVVDALNSGQLMVLNPS